VLEGLARGDRRGDAAYDERVSTQTEDSRQDRRVSIRWIVGGLVALFGAYVCGRAAGILLDVNPYVAEVAAIVVVLVAAVGAYRLRRAPAT
jgi:hypothetical protein